jgi:hypothetical protein
MLLLPLRALWTNSSFSLGGIIFSFMYLSILLLKIQISALLQRCFLFTCEDGLSAPETRIEKTILVVKKTKTQNNNQIVERVENTKICQGIELDVIRVPVRYMKRITLT